MGDYSPATPGRAPSLGGSSSDDGSSSGYAGGPIWMEDSSKLKRKSQAISDASSRMSMGATAAAAGDGKRPVRSPRPAIVAFNMPKDRSAEKCIKTIVEMGHMGNGGPEDVAGELLVNG